jgi:hypothetical protein
MLPWQELAETLLMLKLKLRGGGGEAGDQEKCREEGNKRFTYPFFRSCD